MNIKISGSGQISGGEYDGIRTNGSAKLIGDIKCKTYFSSGTANGTSIECSESFESSGSCCFSGSVKAIRIKTYGSFSADGSIEAGEVLANGRFNAKGDVYAKSITACGAFSSQGLVSAENINIAMTSRASIGSVKGDSVSIFPKRQIIRCVLLFIPRLFSKALRQKAYISAEIEGGNIILTDTNASCVRGKSVTIGKGCKIDVVRYSDSLSVSKKAKIGTIEKL